MKKALLGALLLLASSAWAQSFPSITVVPSAPSGSCTNNLPDKQVATLGTLYSCQSGTYGQIGSGGGSSLLSAKVVYASKLASIPASTAVIPGSSASGTTDAASILNTAISGGNVDLEVDGGYALSTSLVLSSNTTIHCIAPQYGFIMQTASNASVLVNANQNSPTTSSGTGGFLPSNITDQNIKVQGCTLNANSTQAVTGTNSSGTNHGATPGGKFTYGTFFLGVNGLTIDSNEIYDSGCWATFQSNTINARITNNYIHQPSPIVNSKFTDGVHFIGPDQFLWVKNNRINAGDDSIALNADDGNRTGSGDVNATYVQAAVKWGPITDAHIDDNTLDTSNLGFRIYSATELVDRVEVTNLGGSICGTANTLAALTALGNGNIGSLNFTNFAVQSGETCPGVGSYLTAISSNYGSISMDGLSLTNPASTWPVLEQTAGTGKVLSLRNWNLNTISSGFTNAVVLNGGAAGSVAASGINWNDATGAGHIFSGTVVPGVITVSNYAGPNRLLNSGFAPAIENGDAFTNTYASVGTIYVNTTFTEATSGALAGTTPAVCANGCTGTWTAAATGPASGFWTYGTNQVSLGASKTCVSGGVDNFCPLYINSGQSNFTMRVNVSAVDNATTGSMAWVLRWTDNGNFVTIIKAGSAGWEICDVVAGANTCGSPVVFNAVTGLYTIVANGTSISMTNTAGTVSKTISATNTGGNVGFNSTSNGGGGITLTSFEISQN